MARLNLLALAFLLTHPIGTAHARATSAEATMAAARAEGLPVAVLENKIKEGQAKGVPPARVAQVVSQLASHLRAERAWLEKATLASKTRATSRRRQVPKTLWSSVAEARLAGVPRAALQRVVAGKESAALMTRRVDALADLSQRGYSPTTSANLARRARPNDLPALGRRADAIRRAEGLTHDEVVQGMMRGLASGTHLSTGAGGFGRGPGGGGGRGPGPGGTAPGGGFGRQLRRGQR